MTFGGGEGIYKAIGAVSQAGADDLIKAALDRGINFFDTADAYSFGESEKTLGQSFKNLNISRKDVVLATKAYSRVGPGRNDVGASRGHIMDAVEASLSRLQTDYIDLYQIHASDAVTPVEETLRALDTLVNQGKVRYIGVSNWQAWKIARALGISELKNLARFDTLQAYPHTPLIRHYRHLFEAATGTNCSAFFAAGELQSRKALAIIEEFLIKGRLAAYEDGIRYFYSHPIEASGSHP